MYVCVLAHLRVCANVAIAFACVRVLTSDSVIQGTFFKAHCHVFVSIMFSRVHCRLQLQSRLYYKQYI